MMGRRDFARMCVGRLCGGDESLRGASEDPPPEADSRSGSVVRKPAEPPAKSLTSRMRITERSGRM
ncbi:MAG: hypothetical protein GTN72_15385 [Candidatus Latescibacteria bacterium]|nr:hypothetical protein [Candidatus Latescibacterota bacterium]